MGNVINAIKDIFREELDAYGINNYSCILCINILAELTCSLSVTDKTNIEDIYNKIHTLSGIDFNTVKESILYIVNNADFSKSKIFPMFRDTKNKITEEALIKAFVSYVYAT